MELFIEFIKVFVFGVSQYLNVFFSITIWGINFGALFVIGLIVSFVVWLIRG